MNYTLTYQQPYEHDADLPSGIGNHSINYCTDIKGFEASSDEDAEQIVRNFLAENSIVFPNPFDGDAKTHRRKLVCLIRTETVLQGENSGR